MQTTVVNRPFVRILADASELVKDFCESTNGLLINRLVDFATVSTVLLLLAGDGRALADTLADLDPLGHGAGWTGAKLVDDPFAGMGFSERARFTAAVEIDATDVERTDLVDRVGGALEVCGNRLDRQQSTAMLGTRHCIMPGRTEVALVFAIHRLAHLSNEQYREHWLQRHGPIARELTPTTGYEQVHADQTASAELSTQLGLGHTDFDGVALCFFDSARAFVDMLKSRTAQPGVSPVYEDELRFLDHDRSMGVVMGQVTR